MNAHGHQVVNEMHGFITLIGNVYWDAYNVISLCDDAKIGCGWEGDKEGWGVSMPNPWVVMSV